MTVYSTTSGGYFNPLPDVSDPTTVGRDYLEAYESPIVGGGTSVTPAKQKLPKRSLRKQLLRKQAYKASKQRLANKKKSPTKKKPATKKKSAKKQTSAKESQKLIREKAVRSIAMGKQLTKQELNKLSPNMRKFINELTMTNRMRTVATAATIDLPLLTKSNKKLTKKKTKQIMKQLKQLQVDVRKRGKPVKRKYTTSELRFLEGIIHGKVDLTQITSI